MKNPNDYIIDAYRYLQNGKETLTKSPIQFGRYEDPKYVAEAAGIAYLSALKSIDGYLIFIGFGRTELPKSIEEYEVVIKKKIPLNGKLMAALTTAYENLHLGAYYRGQCDTKVVKSGFESCRKVINMMENLMAKPGGTPVIVMESSTPYIRKKRKRLQLLS